ncbi:MAG: hypothetical protein NT062_30520 [Proteobacteria bacterium]|nr:hypothetical protein [Pseudomonadota bacterium]
MYLAVHGSLAGCTSGNGGAVEVSWRLRPSSSSLPDKFLDCAANSLPDTGTVTRIRLDWTVDGTPGSESWRCGDNHGVTGFELQPGVALLSIVPECGDRDALASTYIAPAPLVRDVIAGETISLGALQLELQVNDCTVQPCICQ